MPSSAVKGWVFHDVVACDVHAHAVVKLGAERSADPDRNLRIVDLSAADLDAGRGFPFTGSEWCHGRGGLGGQGRQSSTRRALRLRCPRLRGCWPPRCPLAVACYFVDAVMANAEAGDDASLWQRSVEFSGVGVDVCDKGTHALVCSRMAAAKAGLVLCYSAIN